jgi:hypothetical protein
MKKVLKNVPDDRVRAYIVWLPIFGGDFHGAAKDLSKEMPDKRVTYFQDSDSLTGNLWEKVLQTEREMAWDVYLLYGADAQWEKEPPLPYFWMHQLTGVTKAPRLNVEAFEKKLKEMLNTLPANKTTNNREAQAKGKNLKVEFLYFKNCPSHKKALENLRAALRETDLKGDLILINVDSPEKAEQVGFQGSPSIRINGRDLEGRNEGANYSCRLYHINGKPAPIPSKEFIVERLSGYK